MTIDIDAIRRRWHELQSAPQPGLVTSRLILAEQSADDVPALIREAEQQSAYTKLLAAQLQNARAQVADLADKLHKANADNASLTKAGTAWANEVAELRKQICLIVACSDCGEALEWDGGIVHFRNLDEAKDILDDEGWRVIDGKPMCGDCCHLKPHTFKPERPDGLTCERCDLEEDDHETEQAPAEAGMAR